MVTLKKHFAIFVILFIPFLIQAQNVGIGTTSPDSKLTVVDSVANTISIKTLDNSKSTGISFQNSNGSYVWNLFRKMNGIETSDFTISGGGIESDINNLTERFKITKDGDTKILGNAQISGITDLDSTVTINGDLTMNGNAVFNENSQDKDFRIESNLLENIFFVNGGTNRIGIKTSNPSATLDVVGNTELNGNLITKSGSSIFNLTKGDNDFNISGDNTTNLFFADASTDRIGIGTNNPTTELHVVGNTELNGHLITKSGNSFFNATQGDNDFNISGDNNSTLFFVDASVDRIGIGIGKNNPLAKLDIAGGLIVDGTSLINGSSTASGKFTTHGNSYFNDYGLDKDFRIKSSGESNMFFVDGENNRIGIGTGTPSAELEVNGDIVTTGSSVFNKMKGDNNFRVKSLNNDEMLFVESEFNRVGIGTEVPSVEFEVNGDTKLDGSLATTGYTVFNQDNGNINFRIKGKTEDNLFFVEAISNNIGIKQNNPSADLDILGSFKVNGSTSLIGSTSVNGNTNLDGQLKIDYSSATKWHVELTNPLLTTHRGGIRLDDVGYVEITTKAQNSNPNFARLNSAGQWTAVSDRRLKTNIVKADNLLTKALQLDPVNYLLKSDKNKVKQLGLIAQEVQKVLPEFVAEGDLLTLNYSALSVVAIRAIKELNEKNTFLESRILELEATNDKLVTQVSDLTKMKEQIKKEMMSEMLQNNIDTASRE